MVSHQLVSFSEALIFVLIALSQGEVPESSKVTELEPDVITFNAKEIESIHYEVKIVNEPVVQGSVSASPGLEEGQQQMTMMNKFGQRYRCLLPQTGLDDDTGSDNLSSMAAGETGDAQGGEKRKTSSSMSLSTENVKALLQPMATEPCLIRTKDWWSYELCYGKAVRQFHIEDGKPSGKILVLGHYDHDQDWSETPKSSKDAKVPHHSQFYTNGTICDLTGGYRKTEIRYVCDKLEVADRIIRVDEPQSCDYIITVATAKICPITQLRPEEIAKPKEINCAPLFSQQEYDKWLDIKEKRASILAKKRAEVQKANLAEMLKAVEGEEGVSEIDVETEEGRSKLEGMVGEKLAENLMTSLNDLAGITGVPSKPAAGLDNIRVPPLKFKEIELPSGEKKSVPIPQEDDEGEEEEQNSDKSGASWTRFEKMLDEFSQKIEGADTDASQKNQALKDMTQQLKDLWNDLKVTEEELARVQDMEGELTNQLFSVLGDANPDAAADTEDPFYPDNGAEGSPKPIGTATGGDTPLEQPVVTPTDDDKENDDKKEETKQGESKSAEHVVESKKLFKKVLDGDDNEDSDDDEKAGEDNDDIEENSNIIKVTNLDSSKVRGLSQSESEKRVVKHLENSIKQKIAKSGLEFGGRTIEVKVITAGGGGLPGTGGGSTSIGGPDDDLLLGNVKSEEEKQLQGMVYNLMVGNQQGYADIDEQRQLEMNYKFSLDELSKDTDAKVKRYGDSSPSLPQTGGGDAEPKTVEQPEETSSPSDSKDKSSPHKRDDSEL